MKPLIMCEGSNEKAIMDILKKTSCHDLDVVVYL